MISDVVPAASGQTWRLLEAEFEAGPQSSNLFYTHSCFLTLRNASAELDIQAMGNVYYVHGNKLMSAACVARDNLYACHVRLERLLESFSAFSVCDNLGLHEAVCAWSLLVLIGVLTWTALQWLHLQRCSVRCTAMVTPVTLLGMSQA